MILGIADIIVDMAILTVAAFGVWGLEVATRDVLGMGLVFSPGLWYVQAGTPIIVFW